MINSIAMLMICAGGISENTQIPHWEVERIRKENKEYINEGWKDVLEHGWPEDGVSRLVIWQGNYVQAIWSPVWRLWYSPYIQTTIDEDEIRFYLDIPNF